MSDNSAAAAPRVSSRLSNSAKLSNSISRRVHREIRFGDYILGSTLGQGEFGKVKLGWRKDGKQPEQVAIKLIRKDTVPPKSNRETKVFREINALKILSHPNIVHLEQVIQNDKYIGIVLEYASGGELFDHILTHRYLKDSVACRLFAQLVSGVYYLHSKGIVHRDLKLENLLLDKHKNIIITDFGFANSFKASADGSIYDLMSTSCGSPCYAAPELVVSDSKYVGQKVDVWSCGVILYAMLAGYLPFDDDPANPDGDNITQLYKYITSTPLTFPEYIQPMPRDLLRKILVPDPAHRIDLASVRAHTWLSSHAHFLSVTPQEWDQSYLTQQQHKLASSVQTQASQSASNLTRSQSVQVKSHTAHNPDTFHHHSHHHGHETSVSSSNLQATAAASTTTPTTPRAQPPTNNVPRYNPYQPGHQRTSSATAIPTPTSINATPALPSTGHFPPPPPPPHSNQSQQQQQQQQQSQHASYHTRRHSVQGSYSKGVAPQPRSKMVVDRHPKEAEDVVKSLDIPEYTTTSAHHQSPVTHQIPSTSSITPISENASLVSPALTPTPTAPAEPVAGVTTKPTARLPTARKPRPTSFQPTSTGFAGFLSQDDDRKATEFRVPVSEPRVGLNHDTGLPGEISRPTNSATALSKIGHVDSRKEAVKEQHADHDVKDDSQTESANNTVGTNNTVATSVTTAASSPPRAKTAPTTDSPKSTARTHRRAAASISYGADKFFSKILGSGGAPPTATNTTTSTKERRHSMIPTRTQSRASVTSDQKMNSTDRKRFSLLGFGTESSRNRRGSRASVIMVSNTPTKEERQAMKQQESLNRRATQSAGEPKHATVAAASAAAAKPRTNPGISTKLSDTRTAKTLDLDDEPTKTPQHQDSQSAARKVVEFFKRRSRMV